MTIHFVHRIDSSNAGDISCCPLSYFAEFSSVQWQRHDIYNINYNAITKDDIVILGGGGLIDCLEEWNESINKLFEICQNVILWGAGYNAHFDAQKTTSQIQWQKFKFIGIRDYNHPSGFSYLPCVSCLHPDLQKQFPRKRKIGIIEHKSYPVSVEQAADKITNKTSISEIIEFIGSSDIIITNTYHACYWATLMNKKVILTEAFSSKFDYLKYKPTIYSGNIEKDITIAQQYPQALEESRKLNQQFFQACSSLWAKQKTIISSKVKVEICYIADENYVLPTIVSITSLIKNMNASTYYNVHIFLYDVSEENENRFYELQRNNVNIVLHKNIKLKAIPESSSYVTPTALLKFNIPDILTECDKILYIDGDTLILKGLDELYHTNINGKYAAAAAGTVGMIKNKEHLRVGLPFYFNSGVMLLNLKRMRAENVAETLWQTKLSRTDLHYMDQDVFNVVFNNNVVPLSLKYNCTRTAYKLPVKKLAAIFSTSKKDIKNQLKHPVILHMTDVKKPWKYYKTLFGKLYRSYIDISPVKDKIILKYEYPKWLIKFICCFIPKKKNRQRLREKYMKK